MKKRNVRGSRQLVKINSAVPSAYLVGTLRSVAGLAGVLCHKAEACSGYRSKSQMFQGRSLATMSNSLVICTDVLMPQPPLLRLDYINLLARKSLLGIEARDSEAYVFEICWL